MQDEKNNWREGSERRWLEYTVWRTNRQFIPPTDVIELADKVLVLVEIAALHPNNLNITLLDSHLIITGMRERPMLQNAAYHQVEIGYGEFRVEVALSWQIDREGVSASYRDGLLQIELPRQPESRISVHDRTHKDVE